MKKITFLVLVVILNTFNSYSQSCLPEGKAFTNQIEIDNFQTYYPGCVKIEGEVTISGNDITNLNGLSVLTEIGDALDINENNQLTSLSGLDNLESIGKALSISQNPILTDISALAKIDSVHDDLYIETNEQLFSLEGLHNIVHVEGFVDLLVQRRVKDFSGLRSLVSVGDYFYISELDSVQNFTGLDNLKQANGIGVVHCPMFKNFTGLLKIEKPGNITTITNIGLESFEGLEGVDTLLSLRASNAEGIVNFSHLSGLKYIDDFIQIQECDNLLTFNGLDSLNHLKRIIITGNPELLSLRGIDNVNSNTLTSVTIKSNPELSLCEVQSICDYISMPDQVTDINSNSTKCNSVAEIDTACLYSSFNELVFDDLFYIYPNPATTLINIELYNGADIDEVKLYNQFGQIIEHKVSDKKRIDISTLKTGIYVLEILYNNHYFRTKVIIN